MPRPFFFFFITTSSLLPVQGFLDVREIERAERDIDETVRAEYDDEPDKPPHNGQLPFFALRFIARMRDELEHAPEEHHERSRGEEQDEGIDDLLDDLREERVHETISYPPTWTPAFGVPPVTPDALPKLMEPVRMFTRPQTETITKKPIRPQSIRFLPFSFTSSELAPRMNV